MALNEDAVAARARMLLTSRGEDPSGLPIYRLVALVPEAKRALAVKIASGPRRNALRKDFALTGISGGSVSLAAHLAASEPLILDFARTAEIYSASSDYAWQWKGSRSVLSLQRTDGDFIYWTLVDSTIRTTTSDTSATMTASFEPSLVTVESLGLDDELVEMVAGLVAATPKEEAA